MRANWGAGTIINGLYSLAGHSNISDLKGPHGHECKVGACGCIVVDELCYVG